MTQRVDARAALALLILFLVAVNTLPRLAPAGAGLAALVSLSVLLAQRVPLRALVAPLAAAALFTLPLAIAAPFTETGRELVHGPLFGVSLSVSAEGLRLAGTLAAKVLASVVALVAFARSVPLAEAGRALRWFRVPALVVEVLLMTARYLVLLRAEAGRMLRARRCRTPRRRPRLREAGPLLGTLFVRSLNRGERVHRAMQARGYEGEIPAMSPRPFGRSDVLVLLCGLLVCCALWFVGRALVEGSLP